ncbi:EF-hand domain pair/EF-hand domain/EF hand, putative [Angomonas deanei]|uniref:EF-hand domain pair/EF-hand domain/EF hand, putative n=1 Tax=Angomonas deanei TaxID=59799 RepID=A0A7G2CT01_9TRYP|nr:EF-hand domain pair/EF-hand domain/EF hand, putative [Angomonas deanei]
MKVENRFLSKFNAFLWRRTASTFTTWRTACRPFAARPFSGMLVGWATGALVLGCTSVVLCRPLDTPYYLIPYYLRDVRSRFLHYASTQKRKGGPKYMTADDFVLALLGSPDTELKNPTAAEELKQVFKSMDANGDGYLSFSEFRFLMALLTSNPDDMELLFKIVDDDHNKAISLEQFADVLRGLTDDHAVASSMFNHYSKENGILRTFFGTETEKKQCSYDELSSFIHNLRVQIWTAEFRQYDEDRKDYITVEQFSELIGSQMLGSHLPFFVLNNIRKLQGHNGKITRNMWISFHEILLRGDRLAEALELYSASGLPIDRPAFQRAVCTSGLPELPAKTLNVLFSIFDKDGDGNIEIDEFLSIMQQKMNYHYRGTSRTRVNLPTRFVQCTQEAWNSME